MKKILFLLGAIAILCAILLSQILTEQKISIVKSKIDNLGMENIKELDYQDAVENGVEIFNVDELGSFFTVWVPENYEKMDQKKVIVVLHGTEGTAYAESKSEIEMSKSAYNYAVVGIQWWLGADSYLTPEEVFELIKVAMAYMEETYDADIHNAALEGLSRGSAISFLMPLLEYEQGIDYFKLIICQSGGIHNEISTTPEVENITDPTGILYKLYQGGYGSTPYDGKQFFFYCSLQDEYWGAEMCDYLVYGEEVVESYGGTTGAFVKDPKGSHAGYHSSLQYHKAGVELFYDIANE